jgi:hypothetical protein
VGSCDVRSVVRLAFLLPVSGNVAPDVRVVLVRRCWRIENQQIHVVLCTILMNSVFGREALIHSGVPDLWEL